MDLKLLEDNEADYLLDYETILRIAPSLQCILRKEDAFEFSRQLYEFTRIIYDKYKNEKKELNT